MITKEEIRGVVQEEFDRLNELMIGLMQGSANMILKKLTVLAKEKENDTKSEG